jgi:hypothetical protein
MTLGTIGSSTSILKTLETQGLSEPKAKLVQSQIDTATQAASGLSGTKPEIASVRGALDQKIAADVASGALSQEDAAKVSKTLDDLQAAEGGATAATGAASPTTAAATEASGGGAAAGGGGGGGGGSSEKTELSRSVIVTGAMKTTTITYTDGTTTTEVSASTGGDAKQAAGAKPVDIAGAGAADAEYKPKIEPGILVDALA